ncbi:4-hydroxybenzoate polyprenyltransferase [Thioalkalivibrio denitrificans]|uniref:4-hydroxybenzoate octaprenyltransferase n=1 Tax=Thioalkalivibrio denitrificans TaxID=108003 RepID=A0A1V3NSV1_9GAMM|nr:4-hydroxybenzoate octaprenyltransferase [Thioalkalivibrio denitrificans]OOG28084.1 4-hydroxybenzoate polyprenyltransferase [Thioalkalivibrio denitrificans]
MPHALERLKAYALLVRLHRPIGIYLLLWPTLWALWVAAEGWPRTDVLLIFVAGVVLMRSAGCAINDFADRNIDPHVARTRERPLAAGLVSPKEALGVALALCLAAFVLVLFLNRLTILLSLVAVVLAASYPFMKRLHYLPQVHLGAAFGWAVPMAFAAQTGEFPPTVAWLMFIATVLWATVYDTFYAMADREDDLRLGVKSTAILFGESDRMITGVLQLLLLWCLWLVGREAGLGLWYWLGLALAAGFALYQQYLIVERQPAACFRAFLNNHWFGAAVFGGVFLDYALRA